MNDDLISRSYLKKAIAEFHKEENERLHNPFWNSIGLNALNGLIDNAPPIPLPDFKEWYKQAILDGKTNYSRSQEWIPVSEGLPEIYKEVIVTDIEVSNTYISRYIGNGYWECDNGSFKDRIIAWQEKPKPYKKEGDKNDSRTNFE